MNNQPSKAKQSFKFLIAPMVVVAVMVPCLFLFLFGAVDPYIYSFAVDSQGQLYIGTDGDILIYDDGVLTGRITECTQRSYYFTIEDDTIILATSSSIYTMDLSGNVLTKTEEDPDLYRHLEKKSRQTFIANDNSRYEKSSPFGWTRIIKDETKPVYQLTFFSYAVKVLIFLSAVAFPFAIVYAVISIRLQQKQRNHEAQAP